MTLAVGVAEENLASCLFRCCWFDEKNPPQTGGCRIMEEPDGGGSGSRLCSPTDAVSLADVAVM